MIKNKIGKLFVLVSLTVLLSNFIVQDTYGITSVHVAPRVSVPRVVTSTPKVISTPKVSTSKVVSVPKINTSSKALTNIPKTYSSKSTSSNYYYSATNSSFLSNFWIYRALTPSNRIYEEDGEKKTAPAFTGFTSILPDILILGGIGLIACFIRSIFWY